MISIEKYDWVLEYFRTTGRINRKTYILRMVGRWVVSALALTILFLLDMAVLFVVVALFENNILSDTILSIIYIACWILLFVSFWCFVILYFFAAFAQEIKRLHDCNYSGWWLLTRFIPLASLVYFLVLIFKKGTDGENEYG